jgi:hypothetical protein
MNKNSNAGTSPLPEYGDHQLPQYRNAPLPDWDTERRNVDTGGIDLDANAQLWL